jgi:6-phosphogluconolactonase
VKANLVKFREFSNRSAASHAAAELIADSISSCLEQQSECGLVVSGGSTPGSCFDELSVLPLDWSKVIVIPSDERWVPADHPDSNERLIRERLLRHQAAQGGFLPLFRDGVAADEAPALIDQSLSRLPSPLGCVMLGMGEDGHFASLFPDFDGLKPALDPDNKILSLLVKTAGSPHLRISLSLAALLNTRQTVLLIFGRSKRQVFEAAEQGGSGFPVESLLRHNTSPLTVIWAP